MLGDPPTMREPGTLDLGLVLGAFNMNRRKLIVETIVFTLAVTILLMEGTQAQSSLIAPGDVLIYSRLSGQQGQYVRLSSTFQQVHNIAQDKCSLKSLDGTYVAQSPLPDNSGELIVRRLATQITIIQVP